MRTAVSSELFRLPQIVRVAWIVTLLVLVVVPVALTLARETRFVASIEATSGDAQLSNTALTASLQQAVVPPKDTVETSDPPAKPITPQEARVIADEATLQDRVTATPIAGGALVSVWGSTPAEAARLEDALARKLEQETAGVEQVVLGPRHLPTVTRSVDKVVDALPGPFPGRPHPVWAGVAGLLVAVGFMGFAFIWDRGRPAIACRSQLPSLAPRSNHGDSRRPNHPSDETR
jgi:hypothetical protein